MKKKHILITTILTICLQFSFAQEAGMQDQPILKDYETIRCNVDDLRDELLKKSSEWKSDENHKEHILLKLEGRLPNDSQDEIAAECTLYKDAYFILDFSDCSYEKDYESDPATFNLWINASNIQGVVFPKSTEILSRCVSNNLEFVEITSDLKGYGNYPLTSDSLCYIFDKTGSTEITAESPLLQYNGAEIIRGDYASYMKDHPSSIEEVMENARKNNFNLRIPEESRTTRKTSKTTGEYTLTGIYQDSDRADIYVENISINNPAYSELEQFVNTYVNWNLSRFEEKIIPKWRPYENQRTFRAYISSSTYRNNMSETIHFYYSTEKEVEKSDFVTFTYNADTKSYVSLKEASGYDGKELTSLFMSSLDEIYDGEYIFNFSKYTADPSKAENQPFSFNEDGTITVYFGTDDVSKYEMQILISPKNL